MRNLREDLPKSLSQIKKEQGKQCSIDGCSKPLTTMQGPGSGSLCREHQLKQIEYGGPGRSDRPHTFHRKQFCEVCGYNPYQDPKYQSYKESDPDLFNRLCRAQLIGDHSVIRKVDGGTDTEDNIKTLCLSCDRDKTIVNEDYRRKDT